jgi:hypothetical protein
MTHGLKSLGFGSMVRGIVALVLIGYVLYPLFKSLRRAFLHLFSFQQTH